ncbi:MAG: DUF1566 domain-containing protein, partial [Myxococcales bacterium]
SGRPEGSALASSPQIIRLDAPDEIALARPFTVDLYTDFPQPQDVTLAILSSPNREGYREIQGQTASAGGEQKMRLVGALDGPEYAVGDLLTFLWALKTPDNPPGVYRVWAVRIVAAVDGDGDEDRPADGDIVDGDASDGDVTDGDMIDGDEDREAEREEEQPPTDPVWVDEATGLMWTITAAPVGGVSARSQNDAWRYCDELDYAGHDDWRLPSLLELRQTIRGCEATAAGGACKLDDRCPYLDNCHSADCNGCASLEGPAGGCYWVEAFEGDCLALWTNTLAQPAAEAYFAIDFETAAISWKSPGDNHGEGARCVRGRRRPAVEIGWVQIPPAQTRPPYTFQMGCSSQDTACEPDEQPGHRVELQPFYLSTYEITQVQYAQVMGGNPSAYACNTCPVENVPWPLARTFCELAGGRLPSEAEWEYAARAGSATIYPCGGSFECLIDYEWSVEEAQQNEQPAGALLGNAWGLYDMLGNVAEWVEDVYHPDYTNAPVDGGAWLDPPVGAAEERVVRGASHIYSRSAMRASTRRNGEPSHPQADVGFRCAKDF